MLNNLFSDGDVPRSASISQLIRLLRPLLHKQKHFNMICKYDTSAKTLLPPHRGGSNEYPQSMFLSRNKKNNVYPGKPQFYYIKVGFNGVKII